MVMVVEPLPDELGMAHAGRIAYLNCLSGLEKLLHRTLGSAKDHLKRNEFRQQFHYLATRLAMDPEQYLARHSMLPFLYAHVGRKDEGQSYTPRKRPARPPAEALTEVTAHLRQARDAGSYRTHAISGRH